MGTAQTLGPFLEWPEIFQVILGHYPALGMGQKRVGSELITPLDRTKLCALNMLWFLRKVFGISCGKRALRVRDSGLGSIEINSQPR